MAGGGRGHSPRPSLLTHRTGRARRVIGRHWLSLAAVAGWFAGDHG